MEDLLTSRILFLDAFAKRLQHAAKLVSVENLLTSRMVLGCFCKRFAKRRKAILREHAVLQSEFIVHTLHPFSELTQVMEC